MFADVTKARAVLGYRNDGYAGRAARACGARFARVVHDAGCRNDFLQALHLLGAGRTFDKLRSHLTMPVHLACSLTTWTEVFGEPACLEEIRALSSRQLLHRWRHTCSDGPITCVGHLFEQSPGVQRVVLTRISLL
jgi:hypothetical protein